MHRIVSQEIVRLTVLTPPRSIRKAEAEHFKSEVTPEVANLLAALEVTPFTDTADTADLAEAFSAVFDSVPARTEPPSRPVPQTLANAMHKLVHAAGDLSQQNKMERALTTWLGWNPAEHEPRTTDTSYAGGRARYRRSVASKPPTPSTRELRQQVRDAYEELQDTPDAPRTRQRFARALAALAARFATTARTRSSRLIAPETVLAEASAASPVELNPANLAPPGAESQTRALTRRANLSVLPPVVRLTSMLTLAPGAPSRAVCV